MKRNILIVFSIIVLITVSSCSTEKHTSNSNQKSETTKVVEFKEYDTAKICNLGKVVNTLSDLKTSAVYNPSQAKVLTLKDPEGNEWSMTIPKYALLYSESITMQYVGKVNQDMFSGSNFKGIVLKPEGLSFITPVFISVKGPIVTEKSRMFSASSEGESVNFSRGYLVDNKLSLQIEHFSSYYAYTPTNQSEWEELISKVKSNYDDTVKEVDEFLKTPVAVPPIPPNFDFTCEKTENRPLNVYIQRVIQPEKDYIIKILAASRELSTFGKDEHDGMKYAQKLQERLVKKVDTLIKSYKNDNKKLIPVMNLAFHVHKSAATLGMKTDFASYSRIFSDWMDRAGEELLDRIRQEHYYTGLCKLLPLFHGKAVLETDFSQSSEFYEKTKNKLSDALSFDLSFEGQIKDTGSDTNATWKVEGKVPLTFDIEKMSSKGIFLEGSGTCKYTSYSSNTEVKLIPTTDKVKVSAKLEEVTDQGYNIKINIDRINPSNLKYFAPDVKKEFSFESMHLVVANIFINYYNGVAYEVPVRLQNGQNERVEVMRGNIANDSGGNSSGTVEFTLKHTPK